MKINKLFAILFAVLGVNTLSAQTDVTSTYLTNAGFEGEYSSVYTINTGRYVYQPNGWTVDYKNVSTWNMTVVSSSDEMASNFSDVYAVAADNNRYMVRFRDNQTSEYIDLSQTIEIQESGVYTFSADLIREDGSKVDVLLYAGSTSVSNANPGVWENRSLTVSLSKGETVKVGIKFINKGASGNIIGADNIKITYKPFTDVTEADPVDLTSMASGNWLLSNGNTAGTTATSACGGLEGVSEAYQWGNCLTVGDEALKKSLTNLPVGKYTLEIYCASSTTSTRDNGNYVVTDGDEQYVTLTANDKSIAIPTYNRTSVSEVPLYTFSNVEVTTGNLNLTVNIKVASPNWLMAKVKSITFLGPDKSLEETNFNNNVTALKGLNTEEVPTAFVTQINNVITTYGSADASSMTLSELVDANTEIQTVLNTHSALKTPYGNLNSLITLCETYATEDYSFVEEENTRTKFNEAISSAKTAKGNATTVDALTNIFNTLKLEMKSFVKVAYPTTGNSYDMTSFILNAEVVSKDNWTTNANLATNVDYEGAPDIYALDRWDGGSTNGTEVYARQTLSDLPDGIYTLTAMARGNGENMYYVYATSNNVEYKEVVIGGGNTGNPWGLVTVSNIVVLNGGSMEIGFKGTNNNTWFSVDNFKLSRIYDATTAQNSVQELKSEAELLTGKVMNKDVATALASAINNADATNSDPFKLANMVSDLSTAITAAKASIADYELIAGYIAKANKIDESIAADYKTAYDNGTISESAETIRQKLNVATFNWVSSKFKNEIALTDWGATSNAMWSTSGQHWDGTIGDGCTTYYDANGTNTTHTLSKTVELTQGTYVFRGAGRSSATTTLSLSISIDGIDPVVFNAKGDVGYGIDTEGNATFAEEATYANEDKGRGWEWEFIKFTLTETTTVTLTATSKTTGWGWASFANNGLWMDDATYVVANAGAITAPLAEAKALVGTQPMGTEEDAALTDAIAKAEGSLSTPAELDAAVEALETAVANANAWVAAYNEAKAPLVAALERFEADYNNGEEGALDYMAQSRWATVIEMVEAAAEAKDVTNSYDGFATATENLVAALDAADTSIAEYKALKEALDNANAAAAVNWGDQPFQRPTEDKEDLTTAINTAQTVYDAATADGEGVTSQTTALNDALDVVNNLELNAPAEGSVYNIVVATAGHAFEGVPIVATPGATGDNNPTGYGFAAKDGYTDGPANMLYTFTQVEGNNYHISVKVKGETVYLTYGSLNGSAAGWNQQQIQGTTDIAKAAEFEIVASNTTEGVIKIRNTVYDEFLDCQDGASIFTDTNIEKEDFALTLVEELSAEISIDAADKYATCVLMFDADLANTKGLTVYVPESYTTQDGLNYFVFKVFEEALLPAYTPCLLYAENGFEGTLTGKVKMDGYAYNVAKGGYLYGALESQYITEGYVMVKLDGDEEVTFRNVEKYGLAESIKIPAGKCWLQVPAVQATVSSFTCLFRGGDASNIDEVLLDKISVKDGVIYTLDGKRVSNIERGKIYVINGQKVIVK